MANRPSKLKPEALKLWKKGYTQKEISEETTLHQSTISQYVSEYLWSLPDDKRKLVKMEQETKRLRRKVSSNKNRTEAYKAYIRSHM